MQTDVEKKRVSLCVRSSFLNLLVLGNLGNKMGLAGFLFFVIDASRDKFGSGRRAIKYTDFPSVT